MFTLFVVVSMTIKISQALELNYSYKHTKNKQYRIHVKYGIWTSILRIPQISPMFVHVHFKSSVYLYSNEPEKQSFYDSIHSYIQ